MTRRTLGVPKHIVIVELFSSMKNKQLLDAALASIKTVRKNLGGVTLIGQSANDLGENARRRRHWRTNWALVLRQAGIF